MTPSHLTVAEFWPPVEHFRIRQLCAFPRCVPCLVTLYIIITSRDCGVAVPTLPLLKGGVATDINHGVCELWSDPVISPFLHFSLLLCPQFFVFFVFHGCFSILATCHHTICCVYIHTWIHTYMYAYREPLPSVIHANSPSKKVLWVWLIVDVQHAATTCRSSSRELCNCRCNYHKCVGQRRNDWLLYGTAGWQ